jgi:hypothetical protein
MKRVKLSAYEFASLPAHVTVESSGKGYSLSAALVNAVRNLTHDQRLKRRRIEYFKMSVTVSTIDGEPDDH